MAREGTATDSRGSSVGVPFDKYEGLGNDFVVVEAEAAGILDAKRICDRRYGVGGDGILEILPGEGDAIARMRVVNADGSVPEMCGNGLRCVALHLATTREGIGDAFVVATDAGPKTCRVFAGSGARDVEIDMGIVAYLGSRALDLDGERVDLALGDAGNPHAIRFGDASMDLATRLGPTIEKHPTFPRGTNAEFAKVSPDGIDLVVWERGVGITLACGTGACATAVVACEKGHFPAGTPVTVRLPGGSLVVTWGGPGKSTTMRGPARHVFSGSLDR